MSESIYLKGKGSWIRTDRANEWGKWSMVLYPDEPSLNKLRELQAEGVKNEIKKDEDGWFIRLSRPTELKLRTGARVGLKPPTVFDGNKPLEGGGYAPMLTNTLIGNGSDVVVKVEVYQYKVPNSPGKKAKALRWDSIRVDNLIEFKTKDFTEEEVEVAKSFERPEASRQVNHLW